MVTVAAAEPLFMNAHQVPIGTDIDVSLLLTIAQLAWYGKISTVSEMELLAVLPTIINQMETACHYQPSAQLALLGITLAATPLPTLVLLDLTTMVSSVFPSCPVLREEFGMIPFLNVYALPQASIMVKNVFTVLLDNFMPMEDASALKEPSIMETDVLIKQSTDVLVFPTLTGMELTVFAIQDSKVTETPVFAMESSWEIIAKDVPQSQTLSLKMEFANVTQDMSRLMENVS